MIETELSPIHALPSGLCEDPSRATAALITRMAQQDAAALVELYGLWCPSFLGISCRMLGDRREAEDVVQNTFVRIWNDAADYDPHQAPPFVWAFSIMRRQCIEGLRRLRKRAKKDASRTIPLDLHAAPEKSDTPRVMTLDDSRRVRTALDQLTPDERSCLEMAVFLKYSHSDSPELPGPPLATIKNHLRQALKKMRNHLSRYEL